MVPCRAMAKAPPAPGENLALYEKVVATIPGLDRKGATVPYTSRNGHMFSYLTKSGELALRLPEKERASFLEKYETKLCEAYGIVQKEYVIVPKALFAKTGELKKYFSLSFEWVGSLKPKPTTRKPKKASAKKGIGA